MPDIQPPAPTISFATRLWFAWACFFRVLFDGPFADRVWFVRAGLPAPAPAPTTVSLPPPEPIPSTLPTGAAPAPPRHDSALQLLALFQREGRLVDFLEQDVTSFPDADVGVAARVVHEGCRRALRAHAKLGPIRAEEEGTRVTLPPGFSPADVKLSGNVAGAGPYAGVLRHRGWRALEFSLAIPTSDHDPYVLAQAEVEV